MTLTIETKKPFQANLSVPGDKSISHRSVMISALANGISTIENFLPGEDCLNTVRCIRQLGIKVDEIAADHLEVHGKGLGGLAEPDEVLNVGNSGTTIRLLSGILAGQPFFSVLTGDASIRRRPMDRITTPLRMMGADISGRQGDSLAPLAIRGTHLKAIEYHTPVASAQIKSAVLLAGLFADGGSSVTEPVMSRDHTERMLSGFGIDVKRIGLTAVVKPGQLIPQKIIVPGDISSAAFFMVAGIIVPNSQVTIKRVGLNQTRTGIIDVLEQMGAKISISNEMLISGEPMGDITVENSKLKGITIGGDIIPKLIDEIPILAVAAAVAEGPTVIRDAQELKFKESNRLKAITAELRRFGVNIEETDDGLIIRGGKKYTGAVCESYHDHRIAMAVTLMGMIASGKTIVNNPECIDISLPGFQELLDKL